LFLAIVLLIALTACAKSSSKNESSEIGSTGQIEEAQEAEGAAAEQDQLTDGTTAEQGQLTDGTTAEQGQLTDETTAEQSQLTDETTAEQGQLTDGITAEQSQLTEDVMQLLQQVDEVAQEKFDNLDLNNKESVMEMIQALTQMESAIHLAKYQPIATWDADGKTLSIGQEIRCVSVDGGVGPTLISYMKGREGLVISHYGGDNYSLFYVCDGTLIGKESGHSTGRLDFSGCLPDWKDDPAGETHSIIDGREITDDYSGRNYDEEVEFVEKYLKEAEEILREAGE